MATLSAQDNVEADEINLAGDLEDSVEQQPEQYVGVQEDLKALKKKHPELTWNCVGCLLGINSLHICKVPKLDKAKMGELSEDHVLENNSRKTELSVTRPILIAKRSRGVQNDALKRRNLDVLESKKLFSSMEDPIQNVDHQRGEALI